MNHDFHVYGMPAQKVLMRRLVNILHDFGVSDIVMLASDHGDPPSTRIHLRPGGVRPEVVDILGKCVEAMHAEFYGAA